tara:strand:- start:236 stop:475 length:240 start_codon:yes stop_codon:yes gene_type:complete
MTPNFKENDLVLSFKHFRSLRVDDVVLLDIPKIGTVIKRIKSINGRNISIDGDNKEYLSEIYNKQYNISNVIGKVLFKF